MTFPFKLIDLTHPLCEDTPSWNGRCGFKQIIQLDYDKNEEKVGFRVQQLKMHAGIGTHIDAPAHCIKEGQTVDQIDLNCLVAPSYTLDISAIAYPTYQLSVEDICVFQKEKNIDLDNCFLLIKTGWGSLWGDPEAYRNNNVFPSLSKEAAEYLITQNIKGIGIDTLSPDCIDSGFPVHDILLSHNKYIVENVYFNDQMPYAKGYVMIAPLKTVDGTESPVRLIGLVYKKDFSQLEF
jgi:kynurenine formamidase